MKFLKIALVIFLAFGVSDLFNSDAFARRGGGFSSSRSGGFGSSSRSSSSSRTSSGFGSSSRPSSSSSGSSGFGSSSRPSSPSSGFGSSSRPSSGTSGSSGLSTSGSRQKSSTPQRSTADQALYNKAKSSGTAYTSKSDATSAFRSKYSSQYTSKFDSKPATRPDYIPQTTTAGNKTYNITYDQRYGGYGYMGPSGSWIMYDAIADAAMVSTLMSRHNYYYDRPGTVYENGSNVGVLVGIVFVIVIIGAAVFITTQGV